MRVETYEIHSRIDLINLLYLDLITGEDFDYYLDFLDGDGFVLEFKFGVIPEENRM